MSTISERSIHQQEDNVEVSVYDVSSLSSEYPEWDDLSRAEKIDILEGDADPVSTFTEHNVTTNDYHEHLAELANPDTDTEPNTASHIAFGDGGTAPAPANSSLNNEHSRFDVDDSSISGLEYQSITLISSDQAVGQDLIEAGLYSAASGGMLFNHVLLTSDPLLEPKTQEYAVTIRINLQYKDASEV